MFFCKIFKILDVGNIFGLLYEEIVLCQHPCSKTMLFSSLKTVNKLSSHKWKQVPVCLNKLWFFNFVKL